MQLDYEAAYVELGSGCIEVHHLKPVYTLIEGSKTKLDDLVLLCTKCHRIPHRKRQPLSAYIIRAATPNARVMPSRR